MAVFKCKMCGGSLDIVDKQSTVQCEYCGTTQTLPRLDDDRRANLYDRANHFRRNNEFDKATAIYEQILNEDGTDAEAYWSLVLCRYGIEYVKDPTTQMRVPTVNRAQFTSVFDDDNYKSALQYADAYQQKLYEAEAQAINEIQKGILAISQKEEPFDVFICYKETDANGRRTPDSVLANDLYHQLTNEGFKVFFSRITLEDKLGSAYEPYIFAALNSAKVMVVLGTQPDYFKAVWVRNEWSRYLALVKQSGGKKALIPAYKDMDPYDLPEEFSHLQAQDMSKLGFMQDLIRGIKKLTNTDAPAVVKETVVVNEGSVNTAPLLKRAFMYLEDGDWKSADEYCERVLDMDPENAEAYLGKLMAHRKAKERIDLNHQSDDMDKDPDFRKAVRFANADMKAELLNYRTESIYNFGKKIINAANDLQGKNYEEVEEIEKKFITASQTLSVITNYKDAAFRLQECEKLLKEKALRCALSIKDKVIASRAEVDFEHATKLFKLASNDVQKHIHSMVVDFGRSVLDSAKNDSDYDYAMEIFSRAENNDEAAMGIEQCKVRQQEYRNRLAYSQALTLRRQNTIEALEEAADLFTTLQGFQDSPAQAKLCLEQRDLLIKAQNYNEATQKMRSADLEVLKAARDLFLTAPDYKDSKTLIEKCGKRIKDLECQRERKRRKEARIDWVDSPGTIIGGWLITTAVFALCGYLAYLEYAKKIIIIFEGAEVALVSWGFVVCICGVPFVLLTVWSILKKRLLMPLWGIIPSGVFMLYEFGTQKAQNQMFGMEGVGDLIWNVIVFIVMYVICNIIIFMGYDEHFEA